ncbi:MAG: hypothetical protein JXA49_08590, partial [Actinobacteria bacterium]|nr:hypothetical protein [Actinomycetota bacterium]
EQWMTIENTNSSDTDVTLSYMLEAGGVRTQRIRAPAGSRTTVSVHDYLGPGHDVSTMVTGDLPITVERPMYFNYRGKWTGGHDVLGAREPSYSWYFAEGSTRSNPDDGQYEPWLCLQNPNNEPANAHISYMLEDGTVLTQGFALPPTSRKTVDIGLSVGPNRDVSTEVQSDRPIVAERPMYFAFRNTWQGGHNVMGVNDSSRQWYFAEGCSRDGFNTWLCLGNPQDTAATVTIDYYLGTGQNIQKTVPVAPKSRSTVDVNLDNGPNQDISIRIASDIPILAERPMYFNYHGTWAGGHDSTGTTCPATTWHFAEGCTL